MTPGGDGEDGSGTVMALGVLGVLLVLFTAVLVLGSAVIASHRARSAADLAALAGARETPASCAEARRIAALHGSVVRDCHADGVDLELEVSVTPAGAAAAFGDARARARAGPSTAVENVGADPPGPRTSRSETRVGSSSTTTDGRVRSARAGARRRRMSGPRGGRA